MAKAAKKREPKKSKPKKVAKQPVRALPKKKEPQNKKIAKDAKHQKASAPQPAGKAAPMPPPKVAAPPPVPGRLGEKRGCLKCGTKFYDFERRPIVCPKCGAEFDPKDFAPKVPLKAEQKKAKPVPKVEDPEIEVVVPEVAEDIESLEELGDDEAAEDIAVKEEKDEESYE